jgi:hypothetical protein
VGKLVAIKGDAVRGTDTHNVTGPGPNPAGTPPQLTFVGTGDFKYVGAVTDKTSDFVRVGGGSVALVSSRSSLDPGQTAPTGKHAGPAGANFTAGPTSQVPLPTPATANITDSPLGEGVPNIGAGSGLLTVGGVEVLLDADPIDTCSGVGGLAGSTVAAEGQDFVTCSE